MIAQEAQYRDWMVAALAGDATNYRMLLTALTRHLRSYFSRRLSDSGGVEDAVQETLIAIHTRRATYDPSLPFTAWVYGIARYKLIDEYRRAKRRATVSLDEAADLFCHDETEAAAARRDVSKLLAKLPASKRRLVEQIKLEGTSVAETASNCPMAATGSAMPNASPIAASNRAPAARSSPAMRANSMSSAGPSSIRRHHPVAGSIPARNASNADATPASPSASPRSPPASW